MADHQDREQGLLGDAPIHAVEQAIIESGIADRVERVADRIINIGSPAQPRDRAVLCQYVESHGIKAARRCVSSPRKHRILDRHGLQHAQPDAKHIRRQCATLKAAIALASQETGRTLLVGWAAGQRESGLRVSRCGQAALFERERGVRQRIDHFAGPARGFSLFERHKGDDPACAFVIPQHGRCRAGDPRQCAELRLDLAQLDAKASQLDLMVFAPEKLDLAVWHVAPEVAGIVEPLPGDRMPHEPRSGFLRVVPVAQRQAIASDEQLAGHMHRTWREIRFEDVEALVA
ncbi:hypothetical protein R70199_08177 [Paraburkholderia domus]|nr:hypothetical protein R70199_08177 [Paraburkholderia domus]